MNSPLLKLTLLYPGPSPHAIDMFNALARQTDVELRGLFCMERFSERAGWPTPTVEFEHEYLPVRRWSNKREFGIWNPGLLKRIKAESRSGRLILVGGGYSIPSVAAAMMWLNRSGRPWIFFSEKPGISGSMIKSMLRRRLMIACLSDCSRIVAHSPIAERAYLDLGFSRDRISFVPYAMDVDEFRAIIRRPAVDQERPLRILYLGRLLPIKGIDWAIEGLIDLKDQEGRVSLTIAGDGELRQQLENRVRDAGCGAFIKFIGEIEWKRRAEILAEHDLLLFPSRHDGWGMAVMEAMASGIGVLGSTRAGAISAYVRERDTGISFQPEKKEELKEALTFCIDHREEVMKMGMAARDAVQNWTPETIAGRLKEICSEETV